jgi:thymidylate kinase
MRKVFWTVDKASNKILVQVEGPTSSGKSSFISDLYEKLQLRNISVTIIEEAATKILKESDWLLEQLHSQPTASNQWTRAKILLQKRVLHQQMKDLEWFAKNDEHKVALMDRGGASTAYHTIPLLQDARRSVVEEKCRKIGEMSSQIILLSHLGFISTNSIRYQKTIQEIEEEARGIKHYLDKWKLNYIEIGSDRQADRIRIGSRHVLSLLEQAHRQ